MYFFMSAKGVEVSLGRTAFIQIQKMCLDVVKYVRMGFRRHCL